MGLVLGGNQSVMRCPSKTQEFDNVRPIAGSRPSNPRAKRKGLMLADGPFMPGGDLLNRQKEARQPKP
jgi:hypothetical protein